MVSVGRGLEDVGFDLYADGDAVGVCIGVEPDRAGIGVGVGKGPAMLAEPDLGGYGAEARKNTSPSSGAWLVRTKSRSSE